MEIVKKFMSKDEMKEASSAELIAYRQKLNEEAKDMHMSWNLAGDELISRKAEFKFLLADMGKFREKSSTGLEMDFLQLH